MRALVYDNYTENDDFDSILHVKEIPKPQAGPRDIVFRVESAALNYDDIWGMRGKPLAVPLPHISGSDAAGIVVKIGKDVRNVKLGDRIVSHGNLSCHTCKACTSGQEYNCRNRRIWGFETGPLWGGYCEYSKLPESNAVKIPDNVSYDDAAAASMTMLTSWHMLINRAQIKPGQIVLIMGGASGVGNYGIQIAKLFGCRVISTASCEKLPKLLKLGADYAVDHRKNNWNKEVRKIALNMPKQYGEPTGVDVIFEHIGGTHWKKELELLNYGGILVTTGATTGYDAKTDLRHIFFKGVSILGSTQGTRAELEQGLYWMSKGKIYSIIDSVFSLDDAALAHKRMLHGKGLFGKILIKPQMENK